MVERASRPELSIDTLPAARALAILASSAAEDRARAETVAGIQWEHQLGFSDAESARHRVLESEAMVRGALIVLETIQPPDGQYSWSEVARAAEDEFEATGRFLDFGNPSGDENVG